jgi:predicted acylesterase/phospholipase RssA
MARPWRALALAALIAAGGCAQFPANPPLDHYDPKAGYRFAGLSAEHNSDDLFVILTFSGGGTRAAALAYGVLEALRATPIVWHGERRTLLDEVDVISSVSGGSFAAACYALVREQIFGSPGRPLSEPPVGPGCRDFETGFLKHDVQADLAGQLASPINWLRLASPTFDRIDLAAEYYDREIFHGATYADLLPKGRPYLIVNATDMSQGAGFPFTQDRFDLLCADLAKVPLGRAVAASSAFPVLLTPLTIENYASTKGCGYRPPPWVELALKDYVRNPRRYAKARLVQSYADPERDWIHLLDGGVADNIGLRDPLEAIASNDSSWSLVNAINNGKIKKLVVVIVNARSSPDSSWDRKAQAPGLVDVLETAAGTSIDNYSFETIELLRQKLADYSQSEQVYADCRAILGRQCPAKDMPFPPPPHADYYSINVEFEAVKDQKERHELQNLPTSFSLRPQDVDRLRAVGGQLLRESSDFQRLVGSLQ